jgi:hypothetical protein
MRLFACFPNGLWYFAARPHRGADGDAVGGVEEHLLSRRGRSPLHSRPGGPVSVPIVCSSRRICGPSVYCTMNIRSAA